MPFLNHGELGFTSVMKNHLLFISLYTILTLFPIMLSSIIHDRIMTTFDPRTQLHLVDNALIVVDVPVAIICIFIRMLT